MKIATEAALGLAFAVSLALPQRPVQGGELMKPTVDFNDMRVVVAYVSTGELVNLQDKYGAHIDRREELAQAAEGRTPQPDPRVRPGAQIALARSG